MSQASSSSYGATDNSGDVSYNLTPVASAPSSGSNWLVWGAVAVAVGLVAWFLYKRKK